MTRAIRKPANTTGSSWTTRLFKIGVDAWWLDTTEPETEGREENIQLSHKLAIGSGDRYANSSR